MIPRFIYLKRNHTLEWSCGPVCVMNTCTHVYIEQTVPGKAAGSRGKIQSIIPAQG